MKTVLSALALLLTSTVSFANNGCLSNICVGEQVYICNEKLYQGVLSCDYLSNDQLTSGTIQSITSVNGKIKVELDTQYKGLKTFVLSSPGSVFQTKGCDSYRGEFCVGGEIEHSTSGPGSGTFTADVIGISSDAVLSATGGLHYIDPFDWLFSKK